MIDNELLSRVPKIQGYHVLEPCALFAELGAGGMGAVFRGVHLNLHIEVAVKCLITTPGEHDPGSVDRFIQEASVAAQLTHGNLIRVYDVRQRHGIHYLIMELIHGENARQRIHRTRRPLGVVNASQVILGAAAGLYAAHKEGIIHRDIKPDNILIARSGAVKVADLGLAKAMEENDNITRANAFMGTPQFMCPEQFHDAKSVGPEGDVYAMGVTLFYLLTGRSAIPSGTPVEVMRRVCDNPFPDIREKRKGIPTKLLDILNRCVEKDPSKRYAHAGEVGIAIRKFLHGAKNSLADSSAGSTIPGLEEAVPPSEDDLAEIRSRLQAGGLSRSVAQRRRIQKKSLLGSIAPTLGAMAGISIVFLAWWMFIRTPGSNTPSNTAMSPNELPNRPMVRDETKKVVPLSPVELSIRNKIDTGDLNGAFAETLDSLSTQATLALHDLRSEVEAAIRERILAELEITGPKNDQILGQREIVLTGRCQSETVKILVNTEPAERTSKETFRWTTLAPWDGDFEIRVKAADKNNLFVDLPLHKVRIDTEPPQLRVEMPDRNTWIKGNPVTIQGRVGDGRTHVTQVTANGTSATLDMGKFRVALFLEDGTHKVNVVAIDAGQNTDKKEVLVKVDSTPPTLMLSPGENGLTLKTGTNFIEGKIEDISPCKVKINGIVANVKEGQWSATLDLLPGFQPLSVVAKDAAGNEASLIRNIDVTTVLTWAKAKEGTSFDPDTGHPKHAIHEKTGIEFVLIPGGSYIRGAVDGDNLASPNESQVSVTVKPFYLARTEVTMKQYQTLFRSHLKNQSFYMAFRNPDQPAIMVSWNQAQIFCKRTRLRLPTESEWEYACRAGTTTRFIWGDQIVRGEGFGNFADLNLKKKHSNWTVFPWKDAFTERTAPVASFQQNDFGLYDMIGNVAEWCSDEFPGGGGRRSLRGGSWASSPRDCRSSSRDGDQPDHPSTIVGFRVAHDL